MEHLLVGKKLVTVIKCGERKKIYIFPVPEE